MLAGDYHYEKDGTHLSCGKRHEKNRPVCHCRLITDSNVSAEGPLSVAWEHHLPFSNVLYVISLPPLVSSLLLSWCLTVMKIGGKWGNWEPFSLLSSKNQSSTLETHILQKQLLTYYLWYVCFVNFLFFCGLGMRSICTFYKFGWWSNKNHKFAQWFYTSSPALLFFGAFS